MDDTAAFEIIERQRDRYLFYVRQERSRLTDDIWDDDQTARFAAGAWRIAHGSRSGYVPTAPPLVARHKRVLSAELLRNDWDGSLMAEVELASEAPRSLTSATTSEGQPWAEWSRFDSLTTNAYYVSEQEVAARPYLVPKALALVTLPTGSLPHIASLTATDDPEELAFTTVCELVYLLNQQVTPLIELLEKG